MFIPSRKTTVLWPVDYETPKDGGGFEGHTFKAEFKVLEQSRIDALFARAQQAARGLLDKDDAARLDADMVDEVFVGWQDIKNPDHTEYEVNAANRATLLQMPGMRATLLRSFYETLNGGAERKNSKPPRSTG